MLTIALLLIHSRSKNQNFKPDVIYFWVFLLDIMIVILTFFGILI